MKRQQQRQPTLVVRRETIQQLTEIALDAVCGGETGGAGCTTAGVPTPQTVATAKS